MGRLAELSAEISGLAVPVSVDLENRVDGYESLADDHSSTSLEGRYEQIAKSYWRRFESDDEHSDRVEAATTEANLNYNRAVAGPLAIHHQAMADARPYRGAPKWDRLKAQADFAWHQSTAEAYALFLRSFEDIMRDAEISEETSLLWDALFASQNNSEIAA